MSNIRRWAASAALAVGAATMYRRVVRPWMYAWGARADEVDVVLTGDDLVSASTPRTTRAVSIDASIEAVWPWLVQIGEDRGGFYSYDWLERAVGAHIHNTQIVHPECQVVADIEPKSHLVLMSEPDFDQMARGEKASGAWGFYVRQDDGPSRLLARGSGGAVGHVTFDVPHVVMEQKMLRGIRQRVERARWVGPAC